MATNEKDFLERLERSRMRDIRRVAASTPRRVERERDTFDRVDELLEKLKALGLFAAESAPYTGQVISGARTLGAIRDRDLGGTALGILGLMPGVGGTLHDVATKSGTLRRVGSSWKPGMTQRQAQKAARDRGYRIKKNEYEEFVLTDPEDPSLEYFASDLEDAVTTMDYQANLAGR